MSNIRETNSVNFMEKKVRKNPKYQHVKTKLDTGSSLTRYMERLEESRAYFRYRNNEIFKRLKVTTFAQMLLDAAAVSERTEAEMDLDSQAEKDSVSAVPDSILESQSCRQDAGDSAEICISAKSLQPNVVTGGGDTGGGDSSSKNEVSVPDPVDMPYRHCAFLLLDVRDREQYDRCHIVGANSYPIAMLSRHMDNYIKEMWEYKNAPGKMIILYDEDERTASHAATIMCQRGFENLFMLSGGLKIISKKFPDGMLTGSLPPSCLPTTTVSRRRNSSQQLQEQQEQQEHVKRAEKRWRFTPEELCKIQEHLLEIRSQSRVYSSGCLQSATSKSTSSTLTGAPSVKGQESTGVQCNKGLKLSSSLTSISSKSGVASVPRSQSPGVQDKRPLKKCNSWTTISTKSGTSSIQRRRPWR